MIRHHNSTVFVLLLFLALSRAAVAQAAETEARPLFERHELLNVRIEGPLTTLMKEQPEDEYLDGFLTYTDTGGREHTLDLKLQTRGRYRRQKSTCNFSPLRLNFRKKQVQGTEFAGQDKLKLVTHCQNRKNDFEQLVLREYLAYRILQTLTDKSFGARLMHITYVDSEDNGKSMIKYGFVIEDEDDLADRLGLVPYESRSIEAEELVARQENLVSVFEYMIGNTDFSLILGPRDTSCCHNAILFSEKNTAPYVPIPYDFDFAGLVDAPYAKPNPQFELRNVRQRLYRGRCMNNELIDDTFAYFLDKQDEIRNLVAGLDGLDSRHRKEVENYLDRFYEIITDPKQREYSFVRKCV